MNLLGKGCLAGSDEVQKKVGSQTALAAIASLVFLVLPAMTDDFSTLGGSGLTVPVQPIWSRIRSDLSAKARKTHQLSSNCGINFAATISESK